MGEKPILFSAPMVRALLSGTKTQTRRVVKPGRLGPGGLPSHQPTPDWNAAFYGPGMWSDGADFAAYCPYGQPGDRLWVRENGWERPVRTPKMMREGADTWAPYAYDADAPFGAGPANDAYRELGWKRRPSIHMPRWASRITLEITGVRVERLQAISEADAMAEGIETEGDEWRDYLMPHTQCCLTPRASYRTLWESINGAGSWDENPWVWCVSFKRVTP